MKFLTYITTTALPMKATLIIIPLLVTTSLYLYYLGHPVDFNTGTQPVVLQTDTNVLPVDTDEIEKWWCLDWIEHIRNFERNFQTTLIGVRVSVPDDILITNLPEWVAMHQESVKQEFTEILKAVISLSIQAQITGNPDIYLDFANYMLDSLGRLEGYINPEDRNIVRGIFSQIERSLLNITSLFDRANDPHSGLVENLSVHAKQNIISTARDISREVFNGFACVYCKMQADGVQSLNNHVFQDVPRSINDIADQLEAFT